MNSNAIAQEKGGQVRKKRQRRWYLVNSNTQLYWMGWFFLVAFILLSSFVFSFGVYVITSDSMEVFEAKDWRFNLIKVMLVFWVLLTLLAWGAYIMTLRVSGPIYRFRKVIQSVTRGDYDLPTVKLRKRDEFKELAKEMDLMLSGLQYRRDKTREISRDISERIRKIKNDLKKEGNQPDPEQLAEMLQFVENSCYRLDQLSEPEEE